MMKLSSDRTRHLAPFAETSTVPVRLAGWLSLVTFAVVVSLVDIGPRLSAQTSDKQSHTWALRYRQPVSDSRASYHTLTRSEVWQHAQTAIIVCDMWDLHHCFNAVKRANEFAPRLNQVLARARQLGATVIHAPSGCMDYYTDHPARRRAIKVPAAPNLPVDINAWCNQIPAEEQGTYPLDQSDGGVDDTPDQQAQWKASLKDMGKNPGAPWTRQLETLSIDTQLDFISDQGDEVWNILESRGIHNVILTGVHTNMCVLGRPFGLRQMSKNGKNVVLMRDLTDTMYNPASWPHVNHFTGTDLIVEHIEKFVCPTITSDQLLGESPFQFRQDTRPHIAIVMAEDEYETSMTLPDFSKRFLGHDFRVSLVFGNAEDRNNLPGLEILDQADALIISVRRRVLTVQQMEFARRFVESGKPVIGIRTASHAFTLRDNKVPQGYADWRQFDSQVFGGNYTGHRGNEMIATVRAFPANAKHSILDGVGNDDFDAGGSLYNVTPVASSANVLLTGSVSSGDPEPVAWTFARADGGRSFYTSLGHKEDFANPRFQRLLLNAVYWAFDKPVPSEIPRPSK